MLIGAREEARCARRAKISASEEEVSGGRGEDRVSMYLSGRQILQESRYRVMVRYQERSLELHCPVDPMQSEWVEKEEAACPLLASEMAH